MQTREGLPLPVRMAAGKDDQILSGAMGGGDVEGTAGRCIRGASIARSAATGASSIGRSNAACSTTLTTSLQSFGKSSSWWQWETLGVESQATAQTANTLTDNASATAQTRAICPLL